MFFAGSSRPALNAKEANAGKLSRSRAIGASRRGPRLRRGLGEQRDDGVVAARHLRAIGRLADRTQIGALDHVGLIKQDPAHSRV